MFKHADSVLKYYQEILQQDDIIFLFILSVTLNTSNNMVTKQISDCKEQHHSPHSPWLWLHKSN